MQMFSSCSSRSIGSVLLSKAGCFEDLASCGNYVVEGDEECDAGGEGDTCCTNQCTLMDEADCRYGVNT